MLGTGAASLLNYTPLKALAAPAALIASKLGGFLGDKLGTYMGWGDYAVSENSLLVPEGNSPAAMHSDGKTIRICHREYIGDVISATVAGTFQLSNYQINPANPAAFPWLWNIAVNFQKYKIKGAIIEFKSASGDAITNTDTSLGTVLISSNYNCAEPNFVNRSQMENTQYTSSAKPSVSFVHIIECDPRLQSAVSLYTAVNGIPLTNVGINDTNWVNVQVATLGSQGSAVNLGSIYITYDIELIQPVNQVDGSIFRGDWFTLAGVTTDFQANRLFGAAANAHNSLGGVCTDDRYTFPAHLQTGLFLCCYALGSPAAVTGAGLPTLAYTNCGTVARLPDNAGGFAGAIGYNGIPNMCAQFLVAIARGGAFITFSAGTFEPAQTYGGYWIVNQVDGDFSLAG